MRDGRIARILCLIHLLEKQIIGMTVPEMHQALSARGFKISRRQVYRDTEALAAAGLPLFPAEEAESDSTQVRWKFNHKLLAAAQVS